jgi:SIS domain/Glycosyltransferase family 9 (heptosyltransferase)
MLAPSQGCTGPGAGGGRFCRFRRSRPHVAAAIGTPSIDIFGPTSPWHWAPLNPLAAVIEPKTEVPSRPGDLPLRASSLHGRHPSRTGHRGGAGVALCGARSYETNMTKPDNAVAAVHFRRSLEALERAASDAEFIGQVLAIASACERALREGGKIMLAGNGGSAADAQHIAGEFMSRLRFDRNPLPAVALTTDSSVLTAVGNDYGYDQVFERQVRGRPARRRVHRDLDVGQITQCDHGA